MAAPFDVLAEPTRRRILDLLLERPRLVGDLTERLGLSQPGTSKHLRVLREAGLVQVRPEAQRRWYELRPAPLREVDAWLTPYRRMWDGAIDDLERHLDDMPDRVSDEPGVGTGAGAGRKRGKGHESRKKPETRKKPENPKGRDRS